MSLLTLPAEIRLQIYEHIFADAGTRVYRLDDIPDSQGEVSNASQAKPVFKFAILDVCIAIRTEAQKILQASSPYLFMWDATYASIDKLSSVQSLVSFPTKLEFYLRLGLYTERDDPYRHSVRNQNQIKPFIRSIPAPRGGQSSLTLWIDVSRYAFSYHAPSVETDALLRIIQYCDQMQGWREFRIMYVIWDHRRLTVYKPTFDLTSPGMRACSIVRSESDHTTPQFSFKFADHVGHLEQRSGKAETFLFRDSDIYFGVCAHFQPKRRHDQMRLSE